MIVSTPVLYRALRWSIDRDDLLGPYAWRATATTNYVCDDFIRNNFHVSRHDLIMVHFSTKKLPESVEVKFRAGDSYSCRRFGGGKWRPIFTSLNRILQAGGIPADQKIYVQVEIVEE